MTSGRSGAGLGLIAEAASFRRLFLATFASSIGTWLAFVALVVDVYDRTGDANWVSALLIADFLPIVVVGILLGPLIDRLPRRNILVAADVAACGRLLRPPVRDQRRPDRRARAGRRRRDEPLQAGRVRRAPEPRRRRRPAAMQTGSSSRPRTSPGRSALSREGPSSPRPARCRVLAQCGHIRRLGALHPRHSPEPRGGGASPERRSPSRSRRRPRGW